MGISPSRRTVDHNINTEILKGIKINRPDRVNLYQYFMEKKPKKYERKNDSPKKQIEVLEFPIYNHDFIRDHSNIILNDASSIQ